MAENQPATSSPATKPNPKPAVDRPQPRQGNSGQNVDPGSGMADALQAQHKARTEIPGHPGVDARLDNRQGRFRPQLEEWPAKPQQIDGPDVAHQVEHTRDTLSALTEDIGEVKGAFSIGSHGLSKDESLREGRPVAGPDEG